MDDEDLALLALDEPVPSASAHVAGCARCQRELAGLRATVRTARAADLEPLPPPPTEVWTRIAGELDLADARRAPFPARSGRHARHRARRRPHRAAAAALAAGAAALGVAGVVAFLPGDTSGTAAPGTPPASSTSAPTSSSTPPSTSASTSAPTSAPESGPASPLRPLAGGPGSGRAVLVDSPTGRVLDVATGGLPRSAGFYEVWLLDPDTARMVGLGLLGADGRARLPVPPGVDVTDYPTVDVSDEPADGDPTHSGVSLLRGPRPA